ncbi:HNH endonuclease signature motif containing protein [Actinomycetospora sp. C-140]
MFDTTFQEVPAGLEETPAGAALGAVLERLDPERVSPYDTMRLLAAQRRQLAHQQARFHVCAREAALADPSEPGGRAERADQEGDELRLVLTASRTAVSRILDLADAAARHPELGAAWESGEIDEQRVAILVRWTAALSAEHAAAVIDRLVGEAGGLTPSRLIDRIQALAKHLDAEWAEKLYRAHRRQRRVVARCTDAGTVNLSALDLPFEGGVRSARRLNALAARAQAAGRTGLIDTIRADVILAAFHPDNEGATDAELVAAVVAMAEDDDPQPRRTPDPADASPEEPPAESTGADDTAGDGAAGDPSAGDPSAGDGATGDGAAGDDAAGEAAAGDDAVGDDAVGGDAAGDEPGDDEPAGAVRTGSGETGDPGTAGRRRPTRQSRFELRVGLGTLLELDERPARMPGWGVITAGVARELAAAYGDAEWRVAVSDDEGVLVAALVTRRRPSSTSTTPQEPAVPGAPRPVVELHATEAFLDSLHPADHPEWARLLVDLKHQLAQWRAARAEDDAAREAEERAAREAEGQGRREPAARRDMRPDPFAGPLDALRWSQEAVRRRARAREALARFPSAALRRWVTSRDRSCVFPTCGTSALEAEIDHTLAVMDRGLTVDRNLGPACGHDHDLKDQGWTLTQPRPGWFLWLSPTGHTYERPPRPVLDDLPDCAPPAVRSSTEPDEYATDGPVWATEPRRHRKPSGSATSQGTAPPPSGAPPPGPGTSPGAATPQERPPGRPPPDDPDPPPF